MIAERRHPPRAQDAGQQPGIGLRAEVNPWLDKALSMRSASVATGCARTLDHHHAIISSTTACSYPVLVACADTGLAVLVNVVLMPVLRATCDRGDRPALPHGPGVDIAHMGTVWNVIQAILVAERTPNLYLQTSGVLLDVRTDSRRLGPEKIIMGTDWPGPGFDLERMKIAPAIPDPQASAASGQGGNLAALPSLEPGRMTTADRRNLA